jgi:hypothetical protein
MNVMAAKASHSVCVHRARDEIVALHPVLVRGAICEMRKARLAQLVFFQPPEVSEIQPDMETNRPIIILPLDRTFEWTALGVALNADVVRLDVVELGGVHDVGS